MPMATMNEDITRHLRPAHLGRRTKCGFEALCPHHQDDGSRHTTTAESAAS